MVEHLAGAATHRFQTLGDSAQNMTSSNFG